MTAEQIVPGADERFVWSGAVSVERGQGAAMPWRLPHEDRDLFPPDALLDRAAHPSGVRLRFATDADRVAFRVEPMDEGANVDLYADGELVRTLAFETGATELAFDGLPGGRKTMELWLPTFGRFRLREAVLPPDAALERSDDRRPRWIVYGSSITQCRAAGSPSFTWPGVAARKANLNLTSLGFGGQCHMDPMVARLIRDLPADLVSLKLGINIYGAGSLSKRSFLPAALGTIAAVRESHPETPLAVCSPIFSAQRETEPNAVGLTLPRMREFLADAVERFRARGDRNIHYVDGLKLLGPDDADRLPDDLHPDAEGYRRLGENFAREVFDNLGLRP